MLRLKGGKKAIRLTSVCVALIAFAFFFTSLPTCTLAEQISFNDLSQNNQVYPFVNYLVVKNLISGYPDGSFRPAGSITRAEIAALLARTGGLTGQRPATPTFSDVGPDHWAFEFIEAAVRAGLIKGDTDGSFRPDDPVSRAETAALLLRLTGKASPAISLPDAVRDVSLTHWARNQIAVSLDAGLLTLAAKNSFAPESPSTREQVARGLAVMLNIIPERAVVPLTGTLVPAKGEVTLQEPGKDPRKISADTAFGMGAVIKTGPKGEAELRFSDGSGLRLEENTELTVKKARGRSTILRDGSPGAVVDFLEVDLPKGKVFGALATTYFHRHEENVTQIKATSFILPSSIGRSELLAYGSSRLPEGLLLAQAGEGTENTEWWKGADEEKVRVQVDMPWGVAGIRGTFWMNEVSGDRQITNVVHGSAQVTAGGQTVNVSAGNSTVVTSSGAPPAPPARMSNEEQRDWTQVRDWVNERANTIQNLAPVITPPPPVTEQTTPQTPAPPLANEIVQSFNQATNGVANTNTTPSSSHSGGGVPSDTTPPTVTGANPANNTTAIPVGSSIAITFSENIQEGGNYGGITLKDSLGNMAMLNKSISGNTLTINPGYNLNYSMPAPVSGSIIVVFDTTAPVQDAVHVAVLLNNDTLYGSVSGNVLTVPYSGLSNNTVYTVTIPAGSVISSFYGTTNDPISWKFTTQAR